MMQDTLLQTAGSETRSAVAGFDHPVIGVADMNDAYVAYLRLGFTVPPRGSHLEWGTGNWCIMFPDDYLEIRGIVDSTRYTHNLDTFLASGGPGLMGVALAPCSTAAKSFEVLAGRGIEPLARKHLTRRFELPEGDLFPKFHIVYLDENDTPGLMTTVVCEHLTPQIIRRPDWLDHENGAIGIHSLTAVVDDIDDAFRRLKALFGDDRVSRRGERLLIDPGGGATCSVLSVADAKSRDIALDGGRMPFLAECAITVKDIGVTAAVLEANGVPHAMTMAGSLLVAPDFACGVNLRFVEQGRRD